jgi:hypothetical protein
METLPVGKSKDYTDGDGLAKDDVFDFDEDIWEVEDPWQ